MVQTLYYCNADESCGWKETEGNLPVKVAEFLVCPDCDGEVNTSEVPETVINELEGVSV